jgi:hypothetical protein
MLKMQAESYVGVLLDMLHELNPLGGALHEKLIVANLIRSYHHLLQGRLLLACSVSDSVLLTSSLSSNISLSVWLATVKFLGICLEEFSLVLVVLGSCS